MTTISPAALDFTIEPLTGFGPATADAAQAAPANELPALPTAGDGQPRQRVGLSELDQVVLDPVRQQMLERAFRTCGGPLHWRNRKTAEVRDVLALEQISGRLHIQSIDMREAIQISLVMNVPVPIMDGTGQFHVAPQAFIGVTYSQASMLSPRPGYEFVQVLAPRGVWHANVSVNSQALCLGVSLPAGIRLTEIIVQAFASLSMQNVQIDEQSYAGVLNVEAARWWQAEMHRMPLTRVPFLGKD